MIATFHLEQLIRIFVNTKSGFEVFQEISTPDKTHNLAVNQAGDIFAVSINLDVKIYELAENGSYEETQLITSTQYIQSVGLSPNSQFLFVGDNQGVSAVFERQNGQYQYIQNVTAASPSAVEAIDFHENNKIFVAGEYSGNTRVFELENETNTSFTETQGFFMSYKVWKAKLHENNLMLSGKKAPVVEFYERDGNYSLTSVYDIGTEKFRVAGISEDFKTLVYTTMSRSINVAKKAANETFEIVFTNSST